jgi:hypothetical protein
MRSAILVLLSVLQAWGSARAQGTITGTVVDETGRPLAGAKVHIAEKRFVAHRVIRFYEADSGGRFRIADVPWGTYVIMAGKDSAGYADTTFAFYSGEAVPTVTLAPEFSSADVILRLGPRAGVLDLSSVTDAITGKNISLASVTLRRAESPDLYISESASQGAYTRPFFSRGAC